MWNGETGERVPAAGVATSGWCGRVLGRSAPLQRGAALLSSTIVHRMAQLVSHVPLSCRLGAWMIVGALGLAACRDNGAERASAVDSALARDLTLAASATPDVAIGDTAVASPPAPPEAPAMVEAPTPPPTPAPSPRQTARPTPRPVATPAPRTTPAPVSAPAPSPTPSPAPAPADPPAPAPRSRALGAGTVLAGATNAAICSLAQRPGDRFVVSLGREVTGPDGAMLPQGTPVLVELARVDSAAGEFAFRLKGVQVQGDFIPAEGTVRVSDAAVTERKVSKGGSDQGKVVTGAIIGGILGRVMGGGARGAVIGAAGGAAAGTVAAARNTTTERCMAAGATLTATLSAPLTLPSP